ncbi:MAG: peptidylprolyl isomerase [Vicinamibacteraceae bacterium]
MRPFIGVIALVVLGACNRQPAAASQTTGTAAASAPKPTPAAAGQPAGQPAPAGPAAPGQPGAEKPKPVPAVLPQVLATVNGQNVGREELEAAVKDAESRAGRPVPPTERDTVYRGLLDRVILFKLLASEAKVRGITVTPQEITERIAQIKQQFPTEAEFQKELTKRHTTMAQLEDEQRRDLVNAKTIEAEVAPKLAVTDQDLDAFYKSNPDQFKEPETVRASHILVGVAKDAAPPAKDAAKAEAEGLLKRAKSGEDFAALAKQYSKDSVSAAVGGDLNYFPKGQMVPAFDAAAFAMKPGEISPLIETEFGFHIIKLTDRRIGRVVPLAEVKDRLTEFLKQRKQQELVQQYLLSLKSKYRVEVLL